METPTQYYCPKVFGGTVVLKKRKPRQPIEHKKAFCKRLDGKWDWDVPVWLTKAGTFADCVIKSPEGKLFDTQKEAAENMKKVLTKLGIK